MSEKNKKNGQNGRSIKYAYILVRLKEGKFELECTSSRANAVMMALRHGGVNETEVGAKNSKYANSLLQYSQVQVGQVIIFKRAFS